MTSSVTVTSTLTVASGDDVELDFTFADENGDPASPATVTVTLVAPDGTSTAYVAGTDPEVAPQETGRYVAVFVPDQVGEWSWRIHGTGAGVEAAEVGAFGVSPEPSTSAAPYARWGMTAAVATALTGTPLSTARLFNAEEELVDVLGWRPDPDDYGDPDEAALDHDVRARAFGRAVAWHAAARATTAPSATDGGGGEVASEMIASEYQVAYRQSPTARADTMLAPRARKLLADAGWFAPVTSVRTRPGYGAGRLRRGSTAWQTE
jgi:hypothetical protein